MSVRSQLTIAALGSIVLTTSALSAQTTDSLGARISPTKSSAWELQVTEGDFIPTGHQRDVVKKGKLNAAQLTYVVTPALALTGTLGWARTNDISSVGDPTLDVFTYDLGAELRGDRWNEGGTVSFRPFAGAGAGARSYNYRNLDVDATHNVAAYGSMGGDLAIRRVQIRIEARDYVTGFKPLSGIGAADTRNDVVMMFGVRIAKP
ncbi:MAG: hypothetical protein JWM95_2314 [Gemmatimonadetes bacterium]|nr:hypothetical protein [Gemmatimonadota bacterium]